MGPGSFDPGNATYHGQLSREYVASMGPGSFDPGNDSRRAAGLHNCSGFNGAGVF